MKSSTMSNARQLYEVLRSGIASGEYPPGEKLPSIRTLAETHRLCTNTVNTAIAMLVNEGIATIRKGSGTYVTRAPKKSRMIGVIMFDFTSSTRVDSAILEGIQSNLPAGYYLSLMNTTNSFHDLCESIENLLDAGACGMLIVPPFVPPQEPDALSRIHNLLSFVPTVFLNRGIPGFESDVYSMDLCRGTEEALAYLYSTGKRKPLIILHNSEKFASEQLEACKNHCTNYALPRDSVIAIPMEGSIEDLRDKIRSLLGSYDSFITSDNIMVQMTDIFADNDIRIPEDLSLVGINDTLLSRIHNPPLTSIAFPAKQIGKKAVLRLIDRIEGRHEGNGKLHNYKPDFIIRKT